MEIIMIKDKATKNTIRFKSKDTEDWLDSIYIPKETLDALCYEDGDEIVVSIGCLAN